MPGLRRLLVYAVVVGGSVAAIAVVLQAGDHLFSTDAARLTLSRTPAISRPALGFWTENAHGALSLLLVQLILIIAAARVCGTAAVALRQPAVIGEIAAGILLGPSLFGRLAPHAASFVFPERSIGALRLLADVGIILYMFRVGLDVSFAHLGARMRSAVAVSHFSIVVPFLLGVALAILLYRGYAPPGVPFRAFALFMGIAMSITAFPVLARVLEARGLSNTPLGSTALTCAAVDDITAWSMLAFVVTLVTAGEAGTLLASMLIAGSIFVIGMITVVRWGLARALSSGIVTGGRAAVVLGIAFASALFTEVLGIHALFGAFLAGTIVPSDARVRDQLRRGLESLGAVLLLPLFFTLTGLRTNIGLLSDATAWAVCLLVIATATAGKLLGSMCAARWTGSTWHDAFVLGALMNTRGLMELIALNVGYELGVLSSPMFAILVLMAVVTTVITGPLIDLAG